MGKEWDPEWIKYERSTNGLQYLEALGFFLGMCYIFIGIAIASDIFMSAIETICGATRTVKTRVEESGIILVTTKEVAVWNETVANLTLMALGSSAPEILLSTIEICSGLNRHNPGELGPGTIVGSAAFNLMIISAVCIMSVHKGEVRRIKLYNVFMVTCVSSMFAYLWMAVVLSWITPDEVTIWEALVTLFLFPLLIIIAYLTDRNFFMDRCKKKIPRFSINSGMSAEEGREFRFAEDDYHYLLFDEDGNYDKEGIKRLYIRLMELADLTEKEAVNILANKLIENKHHPKTWYRLKTARALMGGGKMEPVLDEKLKEVVAILDDLDPSSKHTRKSIVVPQHVRSEIMKDKAIAEFQAAAMTVRETVGEFQVTVKRIGKEDVGFKVQVETVEGSAKHGVQYNSVSELITFEPYVKEMSVNVTIINNVNWNPDSNFYLKLSLPEESKETATLGRMRVVEIIIQDDDKPGKLVFDKRGYIFRETDTQAEIDVIRYRGSDGVVSVAWTAIPGPNCKRIARETAGRIVFENNELQKYIQIPFVFIEGMMPTRGQDETFDVVLSDPKGGAKLGKITKTTCAITNDESFKLEINNVVTAAVEICEESEEPLTYKEQIRQAVVVNGGDCKNAKWYHWVIHIICFPLKLLCALIPPPPICGGWLCFLISLCLVGLFTKLVGEFAGNFGKSLKIPPMITAITFVALGTSLPDTFASRIAAVNDKTADNAIGNVTGSNSVNVFLGLGVPWTVGAFFYCFKATKDMTGEETYNPFCVPAGSLTFNVLCFSVCALACIVILIIRRYTVCCGQAELGGPTSWKWITAIIMIVLWAIYIGLSSWEAVDSFYQNLINTEETYCSVLVNHNTMLRLHGI